MTVDERYTERAEGANQTAIARVLASEPRLVAVRPAREGGPGLAPNMILHAAPPIAGSELGPVLRGALSGAAQFEGLAGSAEEAEAGLADGSIALAAAQD